MKVGKFQGDILEGMNCEGGCIAGPACITDPMTVKGRMAKENMQTDKKSIEDSVKLYDLKEFDIEIKKDAE